MADTKLDAIEAELRRLGEPTVSPTMSFTPGEQMAQSPKIAAIEAELKRQEEQERAKVEGKPSVEENPLSMLPESVYPQEAIIPEYEKLPSVWEAPALRTPGGAVAFSTNSSSDDIEKIIRTDNPGVTVETHGNPGQTPYKTYKFKDDPQTYAYHPGMRKSDLARAVPGVVGSALGIAGATALGVPAAATSIPVAVVANVLQSLLGEEAKKLAGADPSMGNVAMSAVTPVAVPALKWAGEKVANKVAAMAAPVGQTVDSVAEPFMERVKNLFTGWGAHDDLSGLAQDVASTTQPAVNAAKNLVSTAAANTETATATAAAGHETATLAAQTAAKDAIGTTRAAAQDAVTKATNQFQDGVAAAGAKAEAAKAAANVPVNSVVDGTIQTLRNWGAGQHSSLDKKFIDYAMGVLEDLEKRAGVLYKELEDKFPKSARIQPGRAFQELQEWLDSKLIGRNPSKFLQQVKNDTGLEKVGKAVRMPQVTDIIRAKQRASDIGHAGIAELADISKGEAKHVAGLLAAVEDKAARDHGLDDVLDKAQAAWAQHQNYRDELEKVLTLKGEKALRDGTVIPALEAAGSETLGGNLLPLKQIMQSAPPGMKQEVMVNIVNRMVDPSKGPENMVAAIKAIAGDKEANELVFKNMPPGARAKLLGLAADAERALAKRGQDIAAAEAAKKAETIALRRQTALTKQGIRNTAMAEKEAARAAETAAIGKSAQKKANTVATAKISEQAAREALAEAERVNIALAPRLRTAGNALVNGDIQPLNEVLKAAPGKEQEVVASALYHTLIDPTKQGQAALNHMRDGLVGLKANPAALARVKSFLPTALSEIEGVTHLAEIIHSGTKAGGKKAEGVLQTLASMGPWAMGKAIGTTSMLTAGALGGGPLAAGVAGAGGLALGRILTSRLTREATLETKAANAILASDVGKALLRQFALEKPVTQGLMNRLSESGPIRAFARIHNMTPVALTRKLVAGAAEHTFREAGEQALSPNGTKE